MRRCSLDFFAYFFVIKAKKHVGFGASAPKNQ